MLASTFTCPRMGASNDGTASLTFVSIETLLQYLKTFLMTQTENYDCGFYITLQIFFMKVSQKLKETICLHMKLQMSIFTCTKTWRGEKKSLLPSTEN